VNEARAKVVIVNKVLHFRPFARLREVAGKLDAEVLLVYRGEAIPASRLLALIGWELTQGAEVEVVVRSKADPSVVLQKITAFIEGGFGEEASPG